MLGTQGGRLCSFLVNISDPLGPKALTQMKTSPALGFGTGNSSVLRTWGPPGSRIGTAFIVLDMLSGSDVVCNHCRGKVGEMDVISVERRVFLVWNVDDVE